MCYIVKLALSPESWFPAYLGNVRDFGFIILFISIQDQPIFEVCALSLTMYRIPLYFRSTSQNAQPKRNRLAERLIASRRWWWRNWTFRGRLYFECLFSVCASPSVAMEWVLTVKTTSKLHSKTHSTVKGTPKTHIKNASEIDPEGPLLVCVFRVRF